MAIEITKLSDVEPERVASLQLLLSQQLQENNPTLDLKRGVLHDLLLYYHAVLSAKHEQELQRYIDARSMAAIIADPSLADTSIVDDVMSNWGVTRSQGTATTGEVTIILATPVSVTIGRGTVFTANGNEYTSDNTFTAKAEAGLIRGVADKLLTATADGKWAFTITVTAKALGTASLIKKDALIIPSALPTSYVTSFATNDFTGGTDTETNEQLLERFQEGVAAKAPSNRITMAAMLRAQPGFARIINQSIVGFGDVEQLRDKHTLFPTAFGGRADWYVRTQERVEVRTLALSAALVTKNIDGTGLWQVSIGRDAAPGFYDISSVRLPTAENVQGTFTVSSFTRSLDLTGDGFIPDIQTVTEGAFSRFQTATVQFIDNVTDHSALSIGATATYNVAVRMMPLIGQIQDFVSGFDIRSYGSDVLIKAPIPCFVQLSFALAKKRTHIDPDLDVIKESLAKVVNNIDFVGRLYASQLHDVIHNTLPAGMSVGAIDMFGSVLWPDDTTHYVRSSEVLVVEGAAESMVSDRTVQFVLDAADISIDIRTDVPVPV